MVVRLPIILALRNDAETEVRPKRIRIASGVLLDRSDRQLVDVPCAAKINRMLADIRHFQQQRSRHFPLDIEAICVSGRVHVVAIERADLERKVAPDAGAAGRIHLAVRDSHRKLVRRIPEQVTAEELRPPLIDAESAAQHGLVVHLISEPEARRELVRIVVHQSARQSVEQPLHSRHVFRGNAATRR